MSRGIFGEAEARKRRHIGHISSLSNEGIGEKTREIWLEIMVPGD
jgi:hypothetical protein